MTNAILKYSFSKLLKFEKELGFETELKWKTVLMILGIHVLGLYWCYLFAFPVKWQSIVLVVSYHTGFFPENVIWTDDHEILSSAASAMYIISRIGITCGVHRLFTHRAYKETLPLKIYLMLCFASSGQNSIYDWVRDHRVHHKFSDTEADPHNVNPGFFFSHIGWLMLKKNSLVLEKGRQIDMSDIENDSVLMFERKYSNQLSTVFCYILPTLTRMLLWGETWQCAIAWQCFIRVLLVLHGEMTVNSLALMYGYRPYNKNIIPTQNAFVATITFGEGHHNYHHVFPYDYKAAGVPRYLKLVHVAHKSLG